MLTHWVQSFLPLFATGSIYYTLNRHRVSLTQPAGGVYHRESGGIRPVVLKVAQTMGATYLFIYHAPNNMRTSFPPHPLFIFGTTTPQQQQWICTIQIVCMLIAYSRVWINRGKVTNNPARDQLKTEKKTNISLSSLAPDNLTSRDGFVRPVPRQSAYSPYSGWIWCLLTVSSRFSRRSPSIYLYRHTSSGQSRVYRVTRVRKDGVHCRESTCTGSMSSR